MGIFGKKKEKENEKEEKDLKEKENDDGEKGDGEGKLVKVKKIKDLNSQNRQRRKEPIRAWNKFDRIILLLVMLSTAGISLFLTASSRGIKPLVFPNFKIPKFNLLGEKTIVLESGDKKHNYQKMMDKFTEITSDLSGEYGIYVINLKDGSSFGINETKEFEPASLNKLPFIVGFYNKYESGVLEDLNKTVTLKNSDKLTGSGSLYYKPAGTTLSYRDLIRYMAKESDNTALNIARKELDKDWEKWLKSFLIYNDMKDSVFSGTDQKTTPWDIGIFFKNLYEGNIIRTQTLRNEVFEMMSDTSYEKWISPGVPDNVRVSHKYGKESQVVNDAGIVFSDDPYVVVILSKGVKEEEADNVIPKLSEIIYQGLSKNP